ncbi:cytochrome c biogenesis CcdA family protein [Fictibacillus aquaticus]|uniref:Cytochrome c biogenesis protein CcdA n=1 Tax=Fictibacillus aquaticus TaxID=2021314 RepID=A0A235F725_9BACL|nr:cytochrome c biogenesis protein CcdA [Fictibacillus aquaticus]OYD56914.1 cytochrome c biogenesis protein CcdA [Fictibacillus aquaticus]
MENVTIVFALTAGLLSFFSPCIFPLIPAYVAHLTGGDIRDGKVHMEKKTVMARSILFILGFSLIFVLMGASASVVGQWFAQYREFVEKISGLLIIVFGFQMLGWLQLTFLMKEKSWGNKSKSDANPIRSFLLGLAFGSGWTPCVGLALSSILLMAGSADTVNSGMLMLWVYSLGLGIPFLFISITVTYSFAAVKKINKWLPKISKVNGAIMVGMGLLLFTGQMQKISSWLAYISVAP